MKFGVILFTTLCNLLFRVESIQGSLLPSEELASAPKVPNSNTNTGDSVVSVQAVWRHGARTQLYTFPTDEHNPAVTRKPGEDGLEQLTRDGVIGSHNLGMYLRARYDTFLAKNFSLEEIVIISSETHRTVMTALALAQGLYPNNMNAAEKDSLPLWYPVPVMTVPQTIDNFLLQVNYCKRHAELFALYKSSPNLNTNETLEFYKNLSLHSGLTVQDYEDVYKLYDTIFNVQRDLFKLPVPQWASSVEYKMFNLAKIEYYGFADSYEMMRFVAGPLIYRIIYNFNCTLGINLKNDTNCKFTKMYGFSGHDTTISPLLYLFQHYDVDSPPSYNALLSFELHQEDNKHFIRIFYRPNNDNEEDSFRELHIKPCGGEPCEFKRFQEIYAPYIIDDETWRQECNNLTSLQANSGRNIWKP